MNRIVRLTVFCFLLADVAFAIGIIFPSGADINKAISAEDLPVEPIEARIDIDITANYVTLRVVQIFRNPKRWNQEGILRFPLQEGISVFSFATWDGARRIPGVILEKRRAVRVYEELRAKAIDPGILLPSARNMFTAKIVPIPPFGTKRLEISCAGLLPEIDGNVRYVLPMAPGNLNDDVMLKRLSVSIEISGRAEIDDISIDGINVPMKLSQQNSFSGEIEMNDVVLPPALTISYSYRQNASELSVMASRLGDTVFGVALFTPPMTSITDEDKPAMAILADISASTENYFAQIFTGAEIAARYSRKYFCIAFNDSFYRIPQAGFSTEPAKIIEMTNSTEPGWGTDLLSALKMAYSGLRSERGRRAIILFSDGAPSVGEIGADAILSLVKEHFDVPIFVVAIGSDISTQLLQSLAERTGGAYIDITEGENIAKTLSAKLEPYVARKKMDMKQFIVKGAELLSVYPENVIFHSGVQTALSFALADLPEPDAKVMITTSDGSRYEAMIGELSDEIFVARMWAWQRVEYLLRLIAQDGERDEWIDEIVELSKRFTFITPYTAFLAAPRAVLRPRIIQPRDPKIIVDAPNAVQVIVVLPWGEQILAVQNRKTLLWEARFLVPQHIKQGEYECLIVITDVSGAQWKQKQKFIVDTTPPEIRVEVVPHNCKPGQIVELRAYAPQDTRKIAAKMPDAKIVTLHWDGTIAASVAKWKVPNQMPEGEYAIKFTAIDFAGNQSEKEIKIIVQ